MIPRGWKTKLKTKMMIMNLKKNKMKNCRMRKSFKVTNGNYFKDNTMFCTTKEIKSSIETKSSCLVFHSLGIVITFTVVLIDILTTAFNFFVKLPLGEKNRKLQKKYKIRKIQKN